MAAIRERILEIARALPAAPRVFSELDGLLRNANCGLPEIAALIKRDATLAAHIIRLSNSVVYGGEQRTGSVEEAVARVGFKEVFRVVGDVAGAQLADRALVCYAVDAQELRDNMLHTAFVCEQLAEECGFDARTAYTAGLMRPLGLLVLDRMADRYGKVEPFHPLHDGDYLTWEGRLFGLASSEVAAMVLAEWTFPQEIVEAVRNQYLLRSADLGHQLACLLNLSGGLVADNGFGLPGETRRWDSSLWKIDAVGLTEERFRAAGERARTAFEGFQRRIRGEAQPVAETPTKPVRVPSLPQVRIHGAITVESSNFPLQVRVVALNNDAPAPVQTRPSEVAPPTEIPAKIPTDFPTFMRAYQDMVFSTAVRLTKNEAQAEDISQEVFLKAHEHFDTLRTSPTAGGWLKTVATNLSLNHLSRYRNRWRFFSEFRRADAGAGGAAPDVEFAAPDTFFAGVDAEERRAWVEKALEQLPDHQRVPLVLYHFEDMPYDEIAKKLRISLAKVKTDILRARTALAKILQRSGPDREIFNT